MVELVRLCPDTRFVLAHVGNPWFRESAEVIYKNMNVWADLSGADLEVALRWAVLYGSLSVTVPTGAAGAVTLERLMEEGSARGLPPLATHKETWT